MSIRKRLEQFARSPFYPAPLSLYPVLALLALNIVETPPGQALRAGLAALILAGCSVFVAFLIFRDWHRAGLAAAVFLLLFFSYGHLYNLVKPLALGDIPIGRHRYLGPLGLGLLAVGWWRVKSVPDPRASTRILNLIAALLLVYPAVQISASVYRANRASFNGLGQVPDKGRTTLPSGDLPDIYYLIPDAYTRDDTMLDVYEFDNTPFLTALEKRGFYVARCSQSNYARTFLSLSSTLNMDFVQTLTPEQDSEKLTALIKDSRVRQFLEGLGYTIVAFDAGYFRTQWPDADLYISYDRSGGGRLIGITEFETILLESTLVRFLLDGGIAAGGDLQEFIYESSRLERYNRTLFTLENLQSIAAVPGPKFVFVHIPIPHEPYIFSATGEFIPDEQAPVPGYADQVAYLNTRLLEIVDILQADSATPPVILIQGDHGGFETKGDFRRLHILNAYYLPEGGDQLYPSITPVNTFRLVFDSYFGEDRGLLPDTSYYSTPERNFEFTVAPVDRPGCE